MIIKLNKEKIRPSSNVKTDYNLKKVIAFNVLVLWQSKKIMAQIMGATKHENHHFAMKLDKDISAIVNILIKKAFFQEELSHGSGKNTDNKLIDFFSQKMAALGSSIFLSNYFC